MINVKMGDARMNSFISCNLDLQLTLDINKKLTLGLSPILLAVI
jgi:hypothetical protein